MCWKTSAGTKEKPSIPKTVRQPCSSGSTICRGCRKWLSSSSGKERAGHRSKWFPRGSRWPRSTSTATGNGLFGRRKAIMTPPFPGYTLFGWQVNRGLKAPPDFYRADQFRKKLERPDVMERLLPTGNLEAAFEAIRQQAPAELHQVLPQQIAGTPRVEILFPRPGDLVRTDSTHVRARIVVPDPAKLVQAKVFANGVVARKQRLIQERPRAEGKELVYEWEVPLPSDRKDLIQLVVATDAPIAAFGDLLIERPDPGPARGEGEIVHRRRGDRPLRRSGDSALEFRGGRCGSRRPDASPASQGALPRRSGCRAEERIGDSRFVEEIARRNSPRTEGSRPARRSARALLRRPWNSRRPDAAVLFRRPRLHDGGSGKNATIPSACHGAISVCWPIFRAGKLVLLDTCHSGAIQPLRSRDLKAAVRGLQEDMVVTLAATTGSEQSAEKKRVAARRVHQVALGGAFRRGRALAGIGRDAQRSRPAMCAAWCRR